MANGQTYISKSSTNYENVLILAEELYEATSLSFAVHLRYNTVGVNSDANTHPFRLSKHVSMMHNKTLDIDPPKPGWSDSRTVAELLKKMMAGDSNFIHSNLFYSFIEHQAGRDNRFVFLDGKRDELIIINEHLGMHTDGIWFSNDYSWDPGTVGLAKRRQKSKGKKAVQDLFDTGYYCDHFQWDEFDVPLAWGSDGVGSRELEHIR